MMDDRVCPSCQVLLRTGTRICPKCGRTVEYAKTNVVFVDLPRKVHSWLVRYLGPLGAGIVAGGVFLILVVVLLGQALLNSVPAK